MASKGIPKANFLFEKEAPPNSAIAPMGVKLNGWGSNRLNAAATIVIVIKKNRELKFIVWVKFVGQK
jgi:hypothetical protein